MKMTVLFVALMAACWGQTFPIAGVVVDSRSGAPMKNVRVTLTSAAHPTEPHSLITAADGRFAFEVPKGKFGLVGEYRGVRQTFGGSAAVSFGISLFTGPDQDTGNLQFRWFAPGAISGKVTDDRGEPVENALVQLIRVSVAMGHKVRSTVAWARTDDLGDYRFGQRASGTYYLAATGEPWYAARVARLPGFTSDGGETEFARSYAPVYYPNSSDPAGAQSLELAPGAEVTADLRLTTVIGVNLHIHCPHPPGQLALITLFTEGVVGIDTSGRQEWMYGDDSTIRGVYPGHYVLQVAGRNGYTASARKAIDVGQSDLTVELTMAPPPTVAGKVTFKDPNRRPRRPAYVRLIDESNGSAVTRAIDAAGGFSFGNVPAGKRLVHISGADGFFSAAISSEGAVTAGPTIDIPPGAAVTLNILASDEIGSVKGFVMNGDKPVSGVLAVLAPKTGSLDPGDYRGFQTDSDGSFDYQNVRAGEYVLFAVPRLDLEYANPAVVRPYLALGKPVQIGAHTSGVENASLLQVIPPN